MYSFVYKISVLLISVLFFRPYHTIFATVVFHIVAWHVLNFKTATDFTFVLFFPSLDKTESLPSQCSPTIVLNTEYIC